MKFMMLIMIPPFIMKYICQPAKRNRKETL